MAAAGCGSAAEQTTPPAPASAVPVRAIQTTSVEPASAARQTSAQQTVGSEQGKLELLSVARTGPAVVTAQLRLTMAKDEAMWSSKLSDSGDNDVSGARMLDEVHGRQYLPLRDDDGECLCTQIVEEALGEGDVVELSVKFPAPDEDVDQVSVQVPGFPSFDQLPI
jgi:hypothetical protein